jgi:hypothetical protein
MTVVATVTVSRVNDANIPVLRRAKRQNTLDFLAGSSS